MTEVLIINPCNQPFSPAFFLIEPVDVLNIASYVKNKGHQVQVLDMDSLQIESSDILKNINGNPDYALIVYDYHIPLHNDNSLENIFKISAALKKKAVKVFVCGKIATYKPELLLRSSDIDAVLRYEAEDTFLELIEKKKINAEIKGIVFKADGKLIQTSLRELFDMKKLPVPDYNLVDINQYINVRSILSSRGCSNHCSFCHVPDFWNMWRGKTAEQVVAEIENLAKNYHSERIMFLDDNALVSKKRMTEICNLILAKGLKVSLGCLGSVSLFDEELLRLMYKAGFRWIHYGAESGSNKMLNKIDKHQSSEDIKRVVVKSREIGFRVRTSWIIDLPSSDIEDIDRTLAFIQELHTDEIRIHFLAMRLGTALYNQNKDGAFSQYIHCSTPVSRQSCVSPEVISSKVDNLIKSMEQQGYISLRDIAEYKKLEKMKFDCRDLKIISLCPLRYGMGWQL